MSDGGSVDFLFQTLNSHRSTLNLPELPMADAAHSHNIESTLHETRRFPPPVEFTSLAHISSEEQYQKMWTRAKDDPAGFWGDLAKEHLHWFKPFDKAMVGSMPNTQWFVGGETNACYNCVDRHLST